MICNSLGCWDFNQDVPEGHQHSFELTITRPGPQEVQEAICQAIAAICNTLKPEVCNTILAGRAELLGRALLARFNGDGFTVTQDDVPPGGMKKQ